MKHFSSRNNFGQGNAGRNRTAQDNGVPSVLKVFDEVWIRLFQSPIHLDSVLSKLPAAHKSIIARILPEILLRPVSLAEALGVGIPPEEPWNLTPEQLAEWRPARVMAERLYEGDLPEYEPSAGDLPGTRAQVPATI